MGYSQEEISAAQVAKIEALTMQNERLLDEYKLQRDHCVRLEEDLRSQADKTAELRRELEIRDMEIKKYKGDCERQKNVIKELTDGLAQQNEAYDVMREKM